MVMKTNDYSFHWHCAFLKHEENLFAIIKVNNYNLLYKSYWYHCFILEAITIDRKVLLPFWSEEVHRNLQNLQY